MPGEADLSALLANLSPELDPVPYIFATLAPGEAIPSGVVPLATFAEAEGLSFIATAVAWHESGRPASADYARLTMTIHSSLAAVGMTAAIAAALTERGISANVVAAYHHDHVFVPWERRDEALEALLAPTEGMRRQQVC